MGNLLLGVVCGAGNWVIGIAMGVTQEDADQGARTVLVEYDEKGFEEASERITQ